MSPMKKIRGRHNRRYAVLKIHTLSDTEIVLSTSFAVYKIPRSYFVTFRTAKQRTIQKATGRLVLTHRFDVNTGQYQHTASYVLEFYFHKLDDLFDVDQFAKFKVKDKNCPLDCCSFRKGLNIIVR